jgi:K+-transporting ATPase ATPase C chain
MKKNLITAVLMTVATTFLLGIVYPLLVTGIAEAVFPNKANGQLIAINGKVIGSRIITQAFTSPAYFHPRPSAVGYDPTNSNGSQWGPTNHQLIVRVKGDVAAAKAENPETPVPIDMVTASASGLDPDITPANAAFQAGRVAKTRGIRADDLRSLIDKHTKGRQLGFLGEPRVNVLELNLELDSRFPTGK